MTGWENNARVPIYDPRDEEEDDDDAALADSSALFIARRIMGLFLADKCPALGIECLALVMGIGYEESSISDIAKRYHCPRYDISKRCVELCDAFGILLADSPALFMARRLIGFILADTYPALGIECLSLVTGIGYEGSSMSDIAKRYHCTRADISKRCVDLCDAFGIPPVRAMRQEKTRECSKDARIRKIIELCEL